MTFLSSLFFSRSHRREEARNVVLVASSSTAPAAGGAPTPTLTQVCANVATEYMQQNSLERVEAERVENLLRCSFTDGEISGLLAAGKMSKVAQQAVALSARLSITERLPELFQKLSESSLSPASLSPMVKALFSDLPQDKQDALFVEGGNLPTSDVVAEAYMEGIREKGLAYLQRNGAQAAPAAPVASSSRSSKSKAVKTELKGPKVSSNWRKKYCPNASYSVTDLCVLFGSGKPCYEPKHAQGLLNELLMHFFLGQDHSQNERIDLCEAVICMMQEQTNASVEFDGRTYGKLFFVNLAVDLGFAKLTVDSSQQFRNELVQKLERFLQVSGADTTQFTVRGEPCSRRDIDFWLSSLRKQPRWVLPSNAVSEALVTSWNSAIKVSDAQSVHMLAVTTTGNKVYDLMRRRVDKLPPVELSEVRRQIEGFFTGKPNAAILKRGLERVATDHAVNTSTGLNTSPSAVLKVLWQYIQNQQDTDVRRSLRQSLWDRFTEIGKEAVGPCQVGRVERLLDVPSGIDESLNVFARQRQIQQDVVGIAAAVNELNLSVVRKVDEFQRRVDTQLVRGQGLEPNEVMPEVNRLIPGFIDD